MRITEYRQLVVDELTSVGIDISAGGIIKKEPPYVQLYPSDTFIEKPEATADGVEDFDITVNYDLTIIAGREDEDASFDQLDTLIAQCVYAVRTLDDVVVTSFVAIDNTGIRYCAATVSFSNTININQGEL